MSSNNDATICSKYTATAFLLGVAFAFLALLMIDTINMLAYIWYCRKAYKRCVTDLERNENAPLRELTRSNPRIFKIEYLWSQHCSWYRKFLGIPKAEPAPAPTAVEMRDIQVERRAPTVEHEHK